MFEVLKKISEYSIWYKIKNPTKKLKQCGIIYIITTIVLSFLVSSAEFELFSFEFFIFNLLIVIINVISFLISVEHLDFYTSSPELAKLHIQEKDFIEEFGLQNFISLKRKPFWDKLDNIVKNIDLLLNNKTISYFQFLENKKELSEFEKYYLEKYKLSLNKLNTMVN